MHLESILVGFITGTGWIAEQGTVGLLTQRPSQA